MTHERLTAGAQRVLAELHRRTGSPSASAAYFRSLLLALLDDDGRAAEILQAADIEAGDIAEPVEPAAGERISLVQWRRTLLRSADRFAINHTADAFTGTEHLLLAAIELDAHTAGLLEAKGITAEALLQTTAEAEPELVVDEQTQIRIEPAGQSAVDVASLPRILDASANRCREGLRVVEDFVRFQLDDAFLSRQLKELRHHLTETLIKLGQSEWIGSRETEHDVGTRSSIASERFRGTVTDVLRASLKRVEESVRSMEEYGKLIDAELSARIEQCRYRFYTIEKAIETALHARTRLQQCRLYLLVTDALCRYGAERLIQNVVAAGVDVIQIREKHLPDRQLIHYARQVRKWTQEAGVMLIINDRPDVAALVGADGVHLGQEDMPVHAARKILGPRGLIGVSTHRIEQAREAVLAGADYLGVGPVFPSRTKAFEQFAGLEYVREVAEELSLPWFAIGGIDVENLHAVQDAGARRVAVSSVICQTPHPRQVTADFARRLVDD